MKVSRSSIFASIVSTAAIAGPALAQQAGGYGRGIARYATTQIIQELEEMTFAFPVTEIGYQRAELSSNEGPARGFAGGAGLGISKPLNGKLGFSTGTRTQADSSQFVGDGNASAFYNDIFDVRSDTLAAGTVIDIVITYSASTLDSTNHTAQTGSLGDNNARNNGSVFLRASSNAPEDNLFVESGQYSRNRAGEVSATGILSQEFMNDDGDPYTHTGLNSFVLKAIVGSTISFEAMIQGDTESRARFGHEANTGFCGSLIWGFDLVDAYLDSRLVPGADIPTTTDVTRERAMLEIPPGPEFVVPAPSCLSLLMLGGVVASRRRR
jgi:hypothetical protein